MKEKWRWNELPDLTDLTGQARRLSKPDDGLLSDLEEHFDALPDCPDAIDEDDAWDQGEE